MFFIKSFIFKVKSRLTTNARRVERVRSKALLINLVDFLRVLRVAQRLRGWLQFLKSKAD